MDALARSVEDEVHKLTGENPVYREGYENAEWILLDYISVVVHIFGRNNAIFMASNVYGLMQKQNA